MRRWAFGVRKVSLVMAAAMVVTIGGGMPRASAAPADNRPPPPEKIVPKTPVVTAKATGKGVVRVSWHNVPKNAASFDVTRTSGGQTVDLTPKGVTGSSFTDRTPPTGDVSYGVKVASVKDATHTVVNKAHPNAKAAKASAGQDLGKADLTVKAVKSPRTTSAERAKARAAARAAHRSAIASRPAAKAVNTASHISADCTISGDLGGDDVWTQDDCPYGFLLTGDVIVPAGALLEIWEGTKVYFAAGTSDFDDVEGKAGLVDLIVRGGLSIQGVLTSPVVLTSINADPRDTEGSPSSGDWGDVAFLDQGSGNASYADISYGGGVYAESTTPWIHDTKFHDLDGDKFTFSALGFWNTAPNGTININGDNIFNTNSYGIGVDSYNNGSYNAGTVYDNSPGVNVNVSTSDLRANYPIWVYDFNGDNSAGSNVNIMASNIQETGGGTAVDVEAASADVNSAASGATSSTATLMISDSNISSIDDDGSAVYLQADDENNTSVTNLTINNSTVSSYYDAVDNFAYGAYAGNGAANGNVTNSQVKSSDYEAFYQGGYTDDPTDTGDAWATASLNGVTLRSPDDYGFDVVAYSEKGSATSSPTVINSNLNSYESAVYSYAEVENTSSTGNALSNPTISGSRLDWGESSDVVDSEAYVDGASSTGNAKAAPSIANSQIDSQSYVGLYVEGDTWGSGDASTAPSVSNSSIKSIYDDYGIEDYADAYGTGSATAGGIIINSVVQSYDEALYGYVTGSGADLATFNINVVNSLLESTDYDAVDFYVYSENFPVLVVSGAVNTSKVQAAAVSSAAAKATNAPTFSGSTLSAPDDYPLDIGAGVYGADAYVNPLVQNSALWGYYGVWLESYDSSEGDDASDLWSGVLDTSGVFVNNNITNQGDEYAIEAYGTSYDNQGPTVVDTVVQNSNFTSYYGLYFDAYNAGNDDDSESTCNGNGEGLTACNTNGPTFTRPRITSTNVNTIESYWEDGVQSYAYSDNGAGTAENSTAVRGYRMNTSQVGVDLYSNSNSANSTLNPIVADNFIDHTFDSGYDGIYLNNSAAGQAILRGAIGGNSVSGKGGGAGVNVYNGASGADDINFTIAGNIIDNVGDEGIHFQGNNTDDDDVVHIVGNTITKTGNDGILTGAVVPDIRSNVQSSADGSYAGIHVADTPSGGLVSCNTVTQNQTGISLTGSPFDDDPLVSENSFSDLQNNRNLPYMLVTDNTGTTLAKGNWWGTTSIADVQAATQTNGGIDILPLRDDVACRGGYIVDMQGGVHGYGDGTPEGGYNTGTKWAGDVARAIATRGDGQSGYILDMAGAMQEFGPAPAPTSYAITGGDTGRDLVLRADGVSGYTLDSWGNVHTWGGAPVVVASHVVPGDNARRLILKPDGESGYVLFKDGTIYPFAPAGISIPPTVGGGAANAGSARDIVSDHSGHWGFVLDQNGSVRPWATYYGNVPPPVTSVNETPATNMARAMTWYNDLGWFTMLGSADRYVFKTLAVPLSSPPAPGLHWNADIARDLDGRA